MRSTSNASVAGSSRGTGPDQAERRRRARVQGTAPGYLLLEGEPGEPWEVRICDVSRDGVGFISSSSMNTGDTCHIRIGHGPMRLARKMTVVACRANSDRTFTIGAAFA
ncbi:MAG: PilZ domain-containing protein [Tepidisphaeraceae bacterium]